MSNALALTGRNDATTTQEETRELECVTLRVGGQLFGIPVGIVRDVLRGLKVTRIPLAPPAIIGALNLRGRVVTAIALSERLGLPTYTAPDPAKIMSIVVEEGNESFSLIVDSVGEVVGIPAAAMEKNPANLSPKWKECSAGIYKADNELLVVLDIPKLLIF